jgi:hypothetical protein
MDSSEIIEDHKRILLFYCRTETDQDKYLVELKEAIKLKNTVLFAFQKAMERFKCEEEFLEYHFIISYKLVQTIRDLINLTGSKSLMIAFHVIKLAEILETYPETIEMFNKRAEFKLHVGMSQMEIAQLIKNNLSDLGPKVLRTEV